MRKTEKDCERAKKTNRARERDSEREKRGKDSQVQKKIANGAIRIHKKNHVRRDDYKAKRMQSI